MCSACFPRSVLPADASLPSTGSSGASSPASAVLSRRYDSLPPIPPHFVSFAWRYPRVHSFSSLPGGRVRRRGLELLTRSPVRELAEEEAGSPRFLGTPNVRSPCSVDAGGTADTRPLRWRSVAPGITKARAPTRGLSALNSMAFGLAVHASRCGLPAPRAGLASSRWSGSTGRVFHPQGSDERFQRVIDISSSSPKLAWRNVIDRSVERSPCARRSDRPADGRDRPAEAGGARRVRLARASNPRRVPRRPTPGPRPQQSFRMAGKAPGGPDRRPGRVPDPEERRAPIADDRGDQSPRGAALAGPRPSR